MRLLFVKHSLVFPRSSGHDVHTFYMMKACAGLGHDVALATVTEPEGPALDGLPLRGRFVLGGPSTHASVPFPATYLQRRFRSFWGVEDSHIAALQRTVGDFKPQAVIVVGLDALPYFPALSGTTRIWYAADEWVLHHLSQLQFKPSVVREHLWAAAVKGLYERAHRGVVDRTWVVSPGDRRAIELVAGMPNVDVLPNGVDSDYFRPGDETVQDRSAVFWGRLDFGPNVQALEWFGAKVWPRVRERVPDARFTIIGFQPTQRILALGGSHGIVVRPNVVDLRSTARQHAVAVLPFVSGAGIKNKLLEAAALGLPILATPLTARGLLGEPPLTTASSPEAFASALVNLWSDATHRRNLGVAARAWVLEHHTWKAAARAAMKPLESAASEAA